MMKMAFRAAVVTAACLLGQSFSVRSPVADMLDAYAEGRLPEARVLAARHLERLSALRPASRSEADKEALAWLSLITARAIAESESRLPEVERFGGDARLFRRTAEALTLGKTLAGDLPAVSPMHDFAASCVVTGARLLIQSGRLIVPSGELAQSYALFRTELASAGIPDLESALTAEPPPPQAESIRRATGEERQQLINLARSYWAALLSGDASLLAAVSGEPLSRAQATLASRARVQREQGVQAVDVDAARLPTALEVFPIAGTPSYSVLIGVTRTRIDARGARRQERDVEMFIVRPRPDGRWALVISAQGGEK